MWYFNQTQKAAAQASVTEYLSFTVGAQSYGVPLSKVCKVRPCGGINPSNGEPTYIIGSLDLASGVAPVVDLRRKFDVVIPGDDRYSVLLILNAGDHNIVLLVDAATDVLAIPDNAVHSLANVGSVNNPSCAVRAAQHNESILLILDPELVLTQDEACPANIAARKCV